jgi:uracil phosphoribosyltransferase
VSIVRAGECLEPALIEVYKDAKIGKILIQTNQKTGEPEVKRNLLILHWEQNKCNVKYIECSVKHR